MFTSMGHREDQHPDPAPRATADGKLTALLHEKTTTSPWDDYAESNSKIVDMLYATPHL